MAKASYISYDNVEIFQGDNFWHLDNGSKIDNKLIYHIKYWDCRLMDTFAKNRIYLKDKIKFSDKLELKKYILKNNLEIINFNLIFVP